MVGGEWAEEAARAPVRHVGGRSADRRTGEARLRRRARRATGRAAADGGRDPRTDAAGAQGAAVQSGAHAVNETRGSLPQPVPLLSTWRVVRPRSPSFRLA